LEKFYKCRYVAFDPRVPPPRLLLRNLKPTYLRTDHWVPLEARAGAVTVLIDDPNHLIKRDSVRALLPSAQLEDRLGLNEHLEAFIHHFCGRQTSAPQSAPVDVAPQELAVEPTNEELREPSPEGDAAADLLDEILREAAARGASDVHVEPCPDDG